MKPIIVRNSWVPKMCSWFIDAYAITLFPFIFVRDEGNETLIRHESIHIQQYAELFIIGFLLLYVWDFIIGLWRYTNFKDAYKAIRFEQEAYKNQSDTQYLDVRVRYAWRKYTV
tara:strand:- start:282 stop:623 length:342 start_codon:yes stop_codon:yes gene_type:complete